MGRIVRLTATTTRPSDATAYAAGDEVSNSATAGSVVRAEFDLTDIPQGRILGLSMDITPASGNFINAASDLEVLLFRKGEVPAAVGDNVTNPIPAATRRLAVADFRFDDGAWMGQLGAVAGTVTSAIQYALSQGTLGLATPALQEAAPQGRVFTFAGAKQSEQKLSAVIRALSTWTPGTVVNTIGLALEVEVL